MFYWHDRRDLPQGNLERCFTDSLSGVSEAPFSALNLGLHVGDDEAHVRENRDLLSAELGGVPIAGSFRCIDRTVHHPALHHLLHGAHALGRHGLHHGPHLVWHTRHRHRRGGRRGGLFLRLCRMVGVMSGLGQSNGRQPGREAKGKGDCSSFHCCSSMSGKTRHHTAHAQPPSDR